MAKKKQEYGNDSITSLKGADRVRKRPAVIFGSDSIDGCKHAVFEIISNSIDEARDGHGNKIIVTSYRDNSVEVEDFGRGCPVDWNANEKRYNWELVYCELYAGGKYQNNENGGDYEYSLGLNGLGACATQYSSEYMDVEVRRDGNKYSLHFEHGENIGGLKTEKLTKNKDATGTKTRWKADLDVFTDINIEPEYFRETLKKQAVVNPGVNFVFRLENADGTFDEETYFYENGISDYLAEIVGANALSTPQYWQCERKGRDREDKPEYNVKIAVAVTFSNKIKLMEYYHNSSFLEHGGSPKDAVKRAFLSQIDAYIKANNKYQKNENKIKFDDIDESLVLISSSFSTLSSYENQTKKAVTNKFIAEAMTDFLKHQLEVYFLENPEEAARILTSYIKD